MGAAADAWFDTAETHSAVIVFVGDRAYKLKKPVRLDFLDFSTREAREEVCHREVALNRRIAPDVYLGVADVLDENGDLCDHLIVMRRMPAEARLSSMIAAGSNVTAHVRRIAAQLAKLHADSSSTAAADEAAGIDATRDRWKANGLTIARLLPQRRGETEVIDALADRYLEGRAALFDDRVRRGRAVDGHGDLMADDIFCLSDGPRILDCIEFDDRFRLGDGLLDATFLAMDLERLGHPELAATFLDAYRDDSGDAWPPSLAHHYVAYRAQVRARVAAVRAEQGDDDAAVRAGSLLALTRAHLERGRVRLVLVGGGPGTGKSTLAASLGASLDAVVLRSDEVRKEHSGLPSLQPAPAPFGEGIYTEAVTSATYEVLLERATTALGMGESVIIDATWLNAALRARARVVAARTCADLDELCCVAPFETMVRRLEERAATQRDASDASPGIARKLLAAAQHWPEAIEIDTSGSQIEVLQSALRLIVAC